MAKNTPIDVINFNPIAGSGIYNEPVITASVKQLTDYGVTIDNKVDAVEIQVLDGVVIYTKDGVDPTTAGAGFRAKVSASEAWIVLSRAEALAFKIIALAGQSPTLNIMTHTYQIKQ